MSDEQILRSAEKKIKALVTERMRNLVTSALQTTLRTPDGDQIYLQRSDVFEVRLPDVEILTADMLCVYHFVDEFHMEALISQLLSRIEIPALLSPVDIVSKFL